MAECPYPKVSKNQNDIVQEEAKTKERRFKKDKRKALISDPLESSMSEESSSDESDNSKDNNALFCISISSESTCEDKCLMAHDLEQDEEVWYFDSGCSRHMTGNKSSLVNFKSIEGPKVVFGGNDRYGSTKGIGTIVRNGLKTEDVSYVESLKFNLLSTSQFCDKGYVVEFFKDKCQVKNESTGEVVLEGTRKRNMYVVT
ncbi:uncharacterized protein LOC116029586 [Ipomoea triloba]|uniref:uncharacterized protein LOC116029586 n=1 Tax=Ipomoea triloba TaxID=35885 RepID=UPI00125E7947|nr:uncharacterized protein LOC116029586 [Ipomoea triloba]